MSDSNNNTISSLERKYDMIPQANQIYRHFKGNLYKVVTVAIHTETEEELVIYQALYGDFKIYARPLSMFMEEVDRVKYPNATQKYRFEAVEQLVEPVVSAPVTNQASQEIMGDKASEAPVAAAEIIEEKVSDNTDDIKEADEESVVLDPLLEEYLDTDSYRERINILHALSHRITEHMLNTMAIVIDFELPEGDIQTKYDALQDCLVTKEKYECNRIL